MDIRQKTPLEASSHPVFEASQALRWNVARNDYLLVVIMQSVEGVEEGVLGRVFPTKELDVINEKNVDVAIPSLEGSTPVVSNGVDEVVGEFF